MKADSFLDTNILIYAAAGKADEPRKHGIARRLIADERFGLSVQVLAEFYANIVRKPAVPPSDDEIDAWLDLLCRFPVVAVDDTLVRTAVLNARRFVISYWDAAVLAAAERLGASILYTEDLNHGQHYGSVLVQNPFRAP